MSRPRAGLAGPGADRRQGRETVIDFVDGGSTKEGVQMLRRASDHHVVGHGENTDVPTIDTISSEINFTGNLVGSYNDLVELVALAAGQSDPAHAEVRARRLPESAPNDLDNGRVRGRAILVP